MWWLQQEGYELLQTHDGSGAIIIVDFLINNGYMVRTGVCVAVVVFQLLGWVPGDGGVFTWLGGCSLLTGAVLAAAEAA